MDLELVSFKTCPFVQRSVITLREKGADFDITYIDLDDPPSWFAGKSPLGLVPILLVRNEGEEHVVFESAVINEFVDEVTEGSLMPEDPLQRAKTRAWIVFGEAALKDYYQAAMAKDEATHAEHVSALKDKLTRLQDQVQGPFFFGDAFTLADAALAPLVLRLDQFAELSPSFDLDAYPTLKAWAQRLDDRKAVQASAVPEWKDLNRRNILQKGGFLGSVVTAPA